MLSVQCYAHYCSSMKTGTCFVVILHVDMLTDLGIWTELNNIFISLQHWSCVVFGECIVYLHFFAKDLRCFAHWVCGCANCVRCFEKQNKTIKIAFKQSRKTVTVEQGLF